MKKHIPSIMFFFAAAIWGFAFPIQKELGVLPVFTTGSIRYILAAIFLFLVIPPLDRLQKNGRRLFSLHGSDISGEKRGKFHIDFTKREIIGGIACGSVLAIGSALQQSGMGAGTDSGKAAFITALYVLIVPIIYLIIGKKSPLYIWVAVGIAVVGFYFLCVKDNLSIAPSDLTVLLCSVAFSVHIIFIGHFSPGCDGVRMSCIQFFAAFLISAPITLVMDGMPDWSLVFNYAPQLFYYGVCSGGIAFTLQVIGQGMDDVNPAVASIILSLESVFGAIGGAILLGEVMAPREYAGCAIVLLAVILSQVNPAAVIKSIKARRNGDNSEA